MSAGGAERRIDAFVLGRVVADLYPLQSETPLEDVRTFERFVGGYGGNVGIGLARLGVRCGVLSGVGDDGHGRFTLKTLQSEGVETRWIAIHPTLRTALTFAEIWPPDHFPLTAYRFPTCPDWELAPGDLPMEEIRVAPLLYVSGTALAQEPSRSAVFAALEARRETAASARETKAVATILDLDWRPTFWVAPAEYPGQIREATGMADTLIGSDSEFAAAALDPSGAMDLGVTRIFLKHGGRGATLLVDERRHEVIGVPVPVVNGLGAGDAFAASVGGGLLDGLDPDELLLRANAAGAIVAGRLACSSAMPTNEEIDAVLR